jgi:histidine triad (HIT) family protein
MSSIFGRIIQGQLPCHKILENEEFLAFLDIKPLNPGHTLVIPKKEVDYFFDLDDNLLGRLMAFSKKVAAMIKKEIPCKKIGVVVAGLEIPHAHVHLVPINALGDLNFAKAKSVSGDALAEIAEKIRAHKA